MPLNPDTLISGLRSFIDKGYSGFTGHPSPSEAPERWASVYASYLAESFNPAPLGVAQAKAAMELALQGLNVPGAALIALPLGFMEAAKAFALGAAPGYLATPPPSPIVLAFPMSTDGGAVALVLAGVIHKWTQTGLAKLAMSPDMPVSWG